MTVGPASAEAAPPAVRLAGVVKRFGPLTAVDALDLRVEAGICLGLLGPNGAGKSTTMRLLTAQARADEGDIEVLGYRLPAQSKQARAECGVVPQLDNLDVELTARQNLAVFARLYRVPAAERRAAVDRGLRIAQLSDRAHTRVDKLSGGMRRRLLLARGLLHRPRLLLLDEPTVGLDPQIRQNLWSLIAGLRDQGVTVLMSTHYIEEAEQLADTVAIMARGRILVRGRPADLVRDYAGTQALDVFGPPADLAEVERQVRARGLPTRPRGPSLTVLRAERLGGESVLGALPTARRPPALEDVFVLLTGEAAEVVT